jgi:transposase-like protein
VVRRALAKPRRVGLPPEKWSSLKSAFEPLEDGAMAQKKHKPEEIVAKLRQVDVLVSQGRSVGEAVRSIGVTQFTYYRWRKEFGGLKTDQVKRLKELEKENERLRKAVSDLTLEKLILREAASGNF